MNARKLRLFVIAAFLTVLVVAAVGFSVLYTVDEREYAVILEFGKPVASRTEPGLYVKMPFIQEVRRLPRTMRFWESGHTQALVDLPTQDGKKIQVTAWAIWRITDPVAFVRVVRTVEKAEADHIRPRVRSAIRNAITTHPLAEVVRSTDRELTYTFQSVLSAVQGSDSGSGRGGPGSVAKIEVGRARIMEEVQQLVQEQLQEVGQEGDSKRGIELVDVGISSIGFVPAVREAAFARLKASMEAIASEYENAGLEAKKTILAETQAEAERIRGEGEQEAETLRGEADAQIIRDYAQAIRDTGDLFEFTRTLELYREGLDRDTRLILTTNSDLFRLLKQVEAAAPLPTPPTVPATTVPPATGNGTDTDAEGTSENPARSDRAP